MNELELLEIIKNQDLTSEEKIILLAHLRGIDMEISELMENANVIANITG